MRVNSVWLFNQYVHAFVSCGRSTRGITLIMHLFHLIFHFPHHRLCPIWNRGELASRYVVTQNVKRAQTPCFTNSLPLILLSPTCAFLFDNVSRHPEHPLSVWGTWPMNLLKPTENSVHFAVHYLSCLAIALGDFSSCTVLAG